MNDGWRKSGKKEVETGRGGRRERLEEEQSIPNCDEACTKANTPGSQLSTQLHSVPNTTTTTTTTTTADRGLRAVSILCVTHHHTDHITSTVKHTHN